MLTKMDRLQIEKFLITGVIKRYKSWTLENILTDGHLSEVNF